MQREMDLIRLIVLAMEDAPFDQPPVLEFEGYTPEEIAYHAYLVMDAGYAVGSEFRPIQSYTPRGMLQHLTWAGHEFAASVREESRWNAATGMVKGKAETVTTGVLTQLLTALMKGQLGLP